MENLLKLYKNLEFIIKIIIFNEQIGLNGPQGRSNSNPLFEYE